MLDQSSPPPTGSIGCGFIGCLGGLIAGLVGGGLLLFLASLAAALAAPAPTPGPSPPDNADLRISLNENFLNRFIEQPAGAAVRVDILPGNQLQFGVNTTLTAFGTSTPVEITGLLQLQVSAETVMVSLVDTQLSGLDLPPELADFFNDDIPIINQNLQTAIDELSNRLGAPATIMGLTTDDTQLQLEIREGP